MYGRTSCIGRGSHLAAGIVAIGMGTAAHAAVSPYVTLEWFASNDASGPIMYHMNQDSGYKSNNGNGTWNFAGSQSCLNEKWHLDWNVAANGNNGGATLGSPGGAFVTADLAVTNTSSTTQSFWALVTLALDNPITGGTLMNGQASAAVTDFLGNGATLGTITSGQFAGDPIYTGRIDAMPQQYLMDSPFTLDANPWSSNSISETFGQPAPVLGPDANTSISVWLKFELTPGDTANVVGMFEIAMAVPGPAALPMLAALGLFAGAHRRRRH